MTSAPCSVLHLPPELVRRIADHLIGIKKWETDEPLPKWTTDSYAPPVRKMDFIGLRTLPSLATTSHLFLEPVLDALWDTLPGYGILVYLLHKDACQWTDTFGSPNEPDDFPDHMKTSPPVQNVYITCSLIQDEINRVQYYTPRVKRIQDPCPLFPRRLQAYYLRCKSSVLEAFVPWWTPTTPLFPNISVLNASPVDEDQCPIFYRFFHVLFGPQLRTIFTDYTTFTNPGSWKVVSWHDYKRTLMRLQELAPHLLHLTLYADAPPYCPMIISAMSTTIQSFKNLVTARTGSLPISEQAFRHLAQLQYLEAIDVRLPDTMAERDIASLHPSPFDEFFPSLRELWLGHRSDLAVISRAVQHVQASRLEIIHAQVLEKRTPVIPLNDALSLLSIVLARPNSERTKELSVEASIEQTSSSTSTFTSSHLEPLFALHSLTHLELRLRCLFDLDDVVLSRVAQAWPHVEVLELGPGTQGDTRVTLAALVPFARNCPRLHTLGIPLDARLELLPAELRGTRQKCEGLGAESPTTSVHVQRALRRLKVGRARISGGSNESKSEVEVAEFLLGLFPRLSYVENDCVPSVVSFGAVIPDATEQEVREEGRRSDCWLRVNNMGIPRMRDWQQTLDEADAVVMRSDGPRRLP